MNRGHRAQGLLAELEVEPPQPVEEDPGEENAAAWARCGALWLSGRKEQPVLCAAPIPHELEARLWALRALAPEAALQGLDAGLLGERAARAGFVRQGSVSPGGSCRFLRAVDGWLAPQLARPDDWHLVPAWLEATIEPGDWLAVGARIANADAAHWVERARLLGIAIGHEVTKVPMNVLGQVCSERGPKPDRPPWVLDLSSLWAGPLCADLLHRCGARVTKVESEGRPDGARLGDVGFYDLMNAGKESVAFDFQSAEGRASLLRLVERADIVIESSRPRALAQLGIDARAWVAAESGRVWCSINGYGRGGDRENWVAYGDDAAVSAGLSVGSPSEPLFVADAIADPLTGVHSALAVWAAWRSGGGRLLDIPMVEVVRTASDEPDETEAQVVDGGWVEAGGRWAIEPPRSRPVLGAARRLGADNRSVSNGLSSP